MQLYAAVERRTVILLGVGVLVLVILLILVSMGRS
jgi:hypothetical protein